MSREIPEWVGATDDTAIPDRVRVRVFTAKGGKCHACGRLIRAGERWVLEHVIALINWLKTEAAPHGNRESNLDLTCCNCLAPKNAADVAEKSLVARKRAKHLGVKKRSSFPKAPPGFKYSWATGRMERT